MPGYRRANHLDWRSREALFVLSAYLCSTLNSCQSLRVASSDNIGEYLMLIFTLIRRYFSMPSWVWSRRRLMLLIKVKYVYPGMYPCLQSCHQWDDSRICGRIMYWVASVFSNSLWFQRFLLTNQYSILTIQIITRTLRLKVLVLCVWTSMVCS
jgi:hypothetical protein